MRKPWALSATIMGAIRNKGYYRLGLMQINAGCDLFLN